MKLASRFPNIVGHADLWARDLYDQIRGRRQPMVPPRRLMYDGPQDADIFVQNGHEFLGYYVDLCHLQPTESVIEIGSGMGRKALPLTSYLDNQGQYLGYEINQAGVRWCRQEISKRYPNFRFEHIDVFNGRYNPEGTFAAHEYTFPTDDGTADLIVLASVFTHMFLNDVSHYLHEISRMLSSTGGRCFISTFILDDEARAGIEGGAGSLRFPYEKDGCYVKDIERPEDAVAYPIETVTKLYEQSGLRIQQIYGGSWCGRANPLSYQDLILAVKDDAGNGAGNDAGNRSGT